MDQFEVECSGDDLGLDLDGELMVTAVASVEMKINGIEVGDFVVAVMGKEVATSADLAAAMKAAPRPALVTIDHPVLEGGDEDEDDNGNGAAGNSAPAPAPAPEPEPEPESPPPPAEVFPIIPRGKPLLDGFLSKQGGFEGGKKQRKMTDAFRKKWKRRWFRLMPALSGSEPPLLLYFEDKGYNFSNPTGSLMIDNTEVAVKLPNKAGCYQFTLRPDGSNLRFMFAETSGERSKWMAALQQCQRHHQHLVACEVAKATPAKRKSVRESIRTSITEMGKEKGDWSDDEA